MDLSFRICYTAISGILNVDSKKIKFEGVFALLVNTYLERGGHHNHVNYTFVQEKTYGVVIDHENMIYDGCIGSMQRNESDIAFVIVASPVLGPNIEQGSAIGFEQMSIVSSYNPVTEQVDTDIVTFFSVFDRNLTLVLILMMIAFTFMLAGVLTFFSREARIMKSYIAKRTRSTVDDRPSSGRSGWQKAALFVLTRWIRQFSAYGITRSVSTVRVLVLLITISCFLIQCYLFSLVKTDLAIVKPPVTIENYDDILERETLLPMWVENLGDYGLFKDAEPGTKERQVWDKAVSMNDAQMSSSMFSLERMFEGDFSSFTKILRQQAIFLMGRTTLYVNRRCLCSLATNMPMPERGSLSRVTVDPQSKEKVLVHVNNANLNPLIKCGVNRRSVDIFEGGITEINRKQTEVMIPSSDANLMKACMSDEVVINPAVVHPPGNWFYRHMWYVCGALLCLSCIILLVETRLLCVTVQIVGRSLAAALVSVLCCFIGLKRSACPQLED